MDTIAPLWLWIFFVASVLVALFVDFVVLRKQGAHAVSVKEALNWSIVWVGLSFAFNGLFWWAVAQDHGAATANTKAMEFLTGYLIEKSLAVDNIFVFLMIFTYFAVPPEFQKRVLMIGIIGAIVLRTVMILVGAWLIQQFHWILYVFGAFLILTGVKMWWAAGQEPDLESNPALKLLRRIMPVSKVFDGENLETVKLEKHSGEVFELREEIAQCVEMVRSGKKPAATGLDGLWSAGLCLVAEESIRQGKPLPVGEMLMFLPPVCDLSAFQARLRDCLQQPWTGIFRLRRRKNAATAVPQRSASSRRSENPPHAPQDR
jgi:hypothetical protein